TVDIDSIYELNRENEILYSYHHNYKNKTQYFTFENALFELLPNGELSRYQDGIKTPYKLDKIDNNKVRILKNNVSRQVFVLVDEKLFLLTYTLKNKVHLKQIF